MIERTLEVTPTDVEPWMLAIKAIFAIWIAKNLYDTASYALSRVRSLA